MEDYKSVRNIAGAATIIGILLMAACACGLVFYILSEATGYAGIWLGGLFCGFLIFCLGKFMDVFIDIARNIKKIADKP